MKIEELPHIDIRRSVLNNEDMLSNWTAKNIKDLMKRKGYYPIIDCMAGSYNIISKLLDDDCVVAYITDKSTTTFLIKTKRQYVGFVSLSTLLAKYLSSNSTRKITRLSTYYDKKDEFMELAKDEDLIVVDKELWEKYLKTKLLESLGDE